MAVERMASMTMAGDVAARMAAIADEVAGPAAADVDERGRFPSEAVDALQAEGLLAALVPVELGGGGAGLAEVSRGLVALGRRCASAAMVVAMHHIQVACLVRHGRNDLLRAYLAELADRQYLLASATTEVGTGGDVRSSICAIEVADGRFRVEKQAPVISYADDADAVLVTARRTADSPESDQVIVLCRPPGLELEQVGEWNALGFRGTCSTGFVLRANGDAASVLDEPYADISTRTMLPTAHLLWSSVWLGIASDAVDLARRFVQREARRKPGTTPPAAVRLAEVTVVHAAVHRPAAVVPGPLRGGRSRRRPPLGDRLRRRHERTEGVGVDAGGRHRPRVHAHLRPLLLPVGLGVQPGSSSAGRDGGRADGQQRPHHGQQRPDAPRPAGGRERLVGRTAAGPRRPARDEPWAAFRAGPPR